MSGMPSTNMPAPTTINSEKQPENPQIGVSNGPDKPANVCSLEEPDTLMEDIRRDAPNCQSEVA